MFVVHPAVDLDAVVSLALLGARPEEIAFVPAGAKMLPPGLEGARVVDHPLGEKGRLDANGVRHAAACSLPEAEGAHPGLLAEVDEQDSTGTVRCPRISLAEILAAIKATKKAEGLNGDTLDRAVYEAFRLIVDGLNLLHRKRQEALAIAKMARIVEIGDFKVAVLTGEQPPEVGMVLNGQGCSVQVYSDGFNLGVFRYPGREVPDLRVLAKSLPGWFVHSAGFLAAWGSKKSPATSPPPKGTPQNSDELVELLRKVYR